MKRKFFLVFLLLTACGRYGPPVPPEVVAPRAVSLFEVRGAENGAVFSWRAPRTDTRGEELKSMDGYRLYRKLISRPSDITDTDVEFELISTIKDEHVTLREKARAEARAEGKPGRRIHAPEASTKFEYLDATVEKGQTYYYKLVPFNQGDVEGEMPALVTVLFDGLASQITLMTDSTIAEPTQAGSIFDSL